MAEYNSYIDSQIPYVGAIPSHWKTVQNKRVMHKEKRICDSYAGQDIISLTMRGAIVRDLGAGGKMPTTFDGYQFVYPGELLMCLFDIDVTPRCVGRVYNEGLTSPAYSSFVLHDNADLGYFYYYYLMLDHTKELLHLAKNLRHSLTEEQLGQIKVPLPPVQEQTAIAAYLDRETERIDAIIAEAKASIEEYKAWKASIIYEAVTKGLDPNAEMKDSCIEWFGMIPQHWLSMKLRYALENISDVDHFMPESVHEGIPYIMTGDLEKMVSQIDIEECKKISMEDYRKLSQKSKIQIDDVIFARYATIGTVSYVDVDLDCIISYSCVVVSPKKDVLSGKYLYYYLQSEAFASEVGKYINTNIQGNVGKESMYKAKILLPPITEQTIIVDHLDRKCQVVDSLIAEKEALVKDMEAYKKSLIFEVVTGKRKV